MKYSGEYYLYRDNYSKKRNIKLKFIHYKKFKHLIYKKTLFRI